MHSPICSQTLFSSEAQEDRCSYILSKAYYQAAQTLVSSLSVFLSGSMKTIIHEYNDRAPLSSSTGCRDLQSSIHSTTLTGNFSSSIVHVYIRGTMLGNKVRGNKAPRDNNGMQHTTTGIHYHIKSLFFCMYLFLAAPELTRQTKITINFRLSRKFLGCA